MDTDKIKEKLPHGAMKMIANETNTGYLTIINFFNGKCIPKNQNQILEVALNLLKKEKERKAELKAEFEKVINTA